jgi:hypothetical protein
MQPGSYSAYAVVTSVDQSPGSAGQTDCLRYTTFTLTVGKAATSTSVVSATKKVRQKKPIRGRLEFAVTNSAKAKLAGGFTVYDGDPALGKRVASGQVTAPIFAINNTKALKPGLHTFVVVFPGSNTLEASQATFTTKIQKFKKKKKKHKNR